MLTEDSMLEIARFIGIGGLALLVIGGVGGVLMASRTIQQIDIKWLRGKMFSYHRLVTLIGAALVVLHPLPMLYAPKLTGGMTFYHILVPFTSPQQTFLTGLGVITFYVLAIVAISSILIKFINREWWRGLHFGTYIIIFLGLAHGLFISGEFIQEEELIDFEEPEKIILLILLIIAISIPLWRLYFAKKFLAKKSAVLNNLEER